VRAVSGGVSGLQNTVEVTSHYYVGRGGTQEEGKVIVEEVFPFCSFGGAGGGVYVDVEQSPEGWSYGTSWGYP
jgi:hypothetical protein